MELTRTPAARACGSRGHRHRRVAPVVAVLSVLAGCVYFNAMYNAEREWGRARAALRDGHPNEAWPALDSVIAKTGRVVAEHPDSKYADDAAILKARAELRRERWEAASATAATASRLAENDRARDVAAGLGGIAAMHLERPGAADSLLTLALESERAEELEERDRSAFHFWRGRARLALERPDAAAEDLRAAVEHASGGDGVQRLELATALARVGAHHESLDLTRTILEDAPPGPLPPAVLDHLDSLVAKWPRATGAMAAGLLEAGELDAAGEAVLFLYRGRSQEELGEWEPAISDYAAAHSAAPTAPAGAEGALRAARLSLRQAAAPRGVTEQLGRIQAAGRYGQDSVRLKAFELQSAAELFGNLMRAFDSRGASAAEALLRAAEVAHGRLSAPALARGLYLRYVDIAPNSRWVGKAIYGALSLSPHRSEWVVEDGGDETDARLRRRLRELPESDPYRAALTGSLAAVPDSAYARAERALRIQLRGIHGLFAEQQPPPAVEDTAGEDATRLAADTLNDRVDGAAIE